MYTLKIALKIFEVVFLSFLCSDCWSTMLSELSEDKRESQFCTHTYSIHTLYSLPAVRSLSIGPCFLSHTGQAAELLYGPWEVGREGSGWLPGSHMSREEVSEQPGEPIRGRPGNGVITLRGNSLFTAPQGFFAMDFIQTPKLQNRDWRQTLMRCFWDVEWVVSDIENEVTPTHILSQA